MATTLLRVLLQRATKPPIYTRPAQKFTRSAALYPADHHLRRAPQPVVIRLRPRLRPTKQRHLLATLGGRYASTKTTTSSTDTRLRSEEEDEDRRSAPRSGRMASDEDYMAFLNKANQDADDAHATAAQSNSSKTMLKALDSGEEAPKEIREVCSKAVYVSDADEPFEQVSLRWTGEGGLPDEEEFAKLINHWDANNAEITIMDPADWDVQGQYGEVVEAVRQASRGNDVRVYRVVRDETRVEYWVVTRAEGRIVGAKALAVES